VSVLGNVLDEVIARYAGGEHQAEAVAARTAYLEATGRVLDDEPQFEERITAFLEWYALERPMDGGARRPIDLYRDELAAPEVKAAARALAATHWSLFQTLELQPGRARIEDLLCGGRFVVHERRSLPGMEPGDVFEARLCADGGKTVFLRAFCFHPSDAESAIRAFIEEAARNGDRKQDVLFRLAERRLRLERYHNVHVAKIYAYK
jgi:hypothetical protein